MDYSLSMTPMPEQIQDFLIAQIPAHPGDIVPYTVLTLGISATTVRRHLGHLVKAGIVMKSGKTRQIRYCLKQQFSQEHVFQLANIEEFKLWQDYFSEKIKSLQNPNLYDTFEYGFTEMVNNAIDHSLGKNLKVSLKIVDDNIECEIFDDGVGAFYTLAKALNFENYRELVLELVKGKLTQDPSNHTGEGIFFTSKAFDFFSITANQYCYLRDNILDDWALIKKENFKKGTKITLRINKNYQCSLIKVFQKFQNPKTLEFDRTYIQVDLSNIGKDSLISRSEAKRVLRNLSGKFTHVMLDFKKIRIVGQGFVDEVFRVFKKKNPEIKIDYCHANEDVEFMIKRSIK